MPLEAVGATVVDPGAETPAVHAVVVDAALGFRRASGGYEGLRAGLDGAWAVVRDVAAARWIDTEAGGQVVLVAPSPGAGEHATALRAALENLVRTLGTEWARHDVTTVAVLPGDRTSPRAVGELVAWLATPAGAYLTGTALTLDRELPPAF